jgi:formate C-acetyltransferase
MLTGVSHAIDSLSMVKKLVFEQKFITLEQAIAAVKANWQGYEHVRQAALTKAPKYGNDDPESDALLSAFFREICDHCDEWNKKIDWIKVTAGVATFENYPRFGHNAGASFDGRFKHEAVSSNYSPSVGRDLHGPTAVMLSATKVDLSRLNSGCPVDMVVSFSKESDEKNSEVLMALIQSFIDLGGNILTLSKVDYAILKKAQERPEDYVSLRVRLGGVTAYFIQLAKPQQDEYMRRMGHQIA